MDDRIVIEPYNKQWPKVFEDEAATLRSAFGGRRIEVAHFGSTAVPGLAAKPIVDILVGVYGLVETDDIKTIEGLGYSFRRHNQPWWAFFRKGAPRTHHLHVIELDSAEGRRHWIEHLGFRNALRSSGDLCGQYERLKRELASRYADDRPAYEDGKTEFIRSVIQDQSERN